GEGMQCCRDTFFLDKTARLEKMPLAVRWQLALAKWKFIQRDAGADNVYLVLIATKFDYRALQRSGANEDPGYAVEHLPRGLAIGGIFHVHQNVGAVKGNDAWFGPRPDQWQKMDGDVPKENVQKLRVLSIQHCPQCAHFSL